MVTSVPKVKPRKNVGVTLDDDEQFFFDNASQYSWRSAEGETQHHGHCTTAILLAEAERYAAKHGWEVDWVPEPDQLGSRGENYTGTLWLVFLHDSEGDELANVGGVESDSDMPAAGEHHRRVVAAELALQAMMPI